VSRTLSVKFDNREIAVFVVEEDTCWANVTRREEAPGEVLWEKFAHRIFILNGKYCDRWDRPFSRYCQRLFEECPNLLELQSRGASFLFPSVSNDDKVTALNLNPTTILCFA
jgi:hypothetical protein